jgi:hypothetical protein
MVNSLVCTHAPVGPPPLFSAVVRVRSQVRDQPRSVLPSCVIALFSTGHQDC